MAFKEIIVILPVTITLVDGEKIRVEFGTKDELDGGDAMLAGVLQQMENDAECVFADRQALQNIISKFRSSGAKHVKIVS